MDEFRNYYAKWHKSEEDKLSYDFTFMWYLKIKTKQRTSREQTNWWLPDEKWVRNGQNR